MRLIAIMKLLRSAACGLIVLLGAIAFALAQDPKPDKTAKKSKPAEQRPQPQAPQRSVAQAREWQQQRGWLRQGGGWKGRELWQQARADKWSVEHRTWAQRGGYGGFYVPPDRYALSFGDQHTFRLTRPTIREGYPRFEYGGFVFLLLDPFPEYWADNWYEVDDLYIDFDDGYYLHNRAYTQVRLAITVFL